MAVQRRFLPANWFKTNASAAPGTRLPSYVREYLRMVRTQLLVCVGDKQQIASPTLRAIVEKADAECDWADLFAMEDAFNALMPESHVYDAIWIWRTRYRQIVGAPLYEEYLKTKPPDPSGERTSELAGALREDIFSLAARVHYAYAFNPPKEKMRNRLTMLNAASIVAVTLWTLQPALALSITWPFVALKAACPAWHCLQFTSLQIVVLSGVLGGFISVQQRLQSWSDVDPLFKRLEISSGWFSIAAVAPLTGAIFAIAFYMICFAGAISGGVFPQFAAVDYAHDPRVNALGSDFATFLQWSLPREPADWAKLILWSFIAGFAERFVPDVLTRLANVQYAVGGAVKTGTPS